MRTVLDEFEDFEEEPIQASRRGIPPLIVAALAIQFFLIAAIGYKLFTVESRGGADSVSARADGDRLGGKVPRPGPIHSVAPLLINLNEPGEVRFLKIAVDLELRSAGALDDIAALDRVIRDDFLRYLSNLRAAETLGEAAKLKIKAALLERVNAILGAPLVQRVLFSEFVIQ